MDDAIAAVRRFNRFYTQRIGALEDRFLGSDLSLGEARLLFEIAQSDQPVAADLRMALGIDAGYVSRIIRRFEARGWIVRARGTRDARRRPITLTREGRKVFDGIDARQRAQVMAMLEPLPASQRTDLAHALDTVRLLLGGAPQAGFTIRPFRTGDIGMICARQSLVYKEAYGWGREAEIIEGDVTTAFLRGFKDGREQCWVAEVEGVLAGSVFVTDEGADVARLRLFYVEPFARGRGIGNALVGTCVGFARDAGFTTLMLWTQTILESARRIYAGHGFRMIETALHHELGEPVMGETWRLDLRP